MIFQPIITGTQFPELTNPGTANDLLAGKQLIDQYGNPLTGTIPTKTGSNISVSGPTIIVPSGYYGSQVSKSVATATQATPTISVNSSGLITASSTQSAGYVTAGTKNATRQLTTQAGKTITPGTSQQTAVASGRYTTGTVYVAGDSDLKAENIKKGINIFGVTGALEDVTFYWEELTLSDPRQSGLTGSLLSIEVDGEFTYEPKVLLAYIYEVRGTTVRAWARGGSIYTFKGIIDNVIEEEWYTFSDVWEGEQGGPDDSSGSSVGASNPSKKVGKTVTFDINLYRDYFPSIDYIRRINITALYTY